MAKLLARILWRTRAVIRPPVTLGVRCLVIDPQERVVLVRHTYTPGWHIPGGAVDPKESAREAALRELAEETGLSVSEPAAFFGFYFHKALEERDHVALYVVRTAQSLEDRSLKGPAAEIADAGVFNPDDLPDTTAASVHQRLAEVRGQSPISEIW